MAKHLKKAAADATGNVVEKLDAARKRIEILESYQESLKREADSWMNESHKWAAVAKERDKELGELRDRLGDLKQKHLDVKLALAEREGYIARVNEQEGRPLKSDVATPTDAAPQTGDYPMGGTTPFARAAAIDRVRRFAAERDYLRNRHWTY